MLLTKGCRLDGCSDTACCLTCADTQPCCIAPRFPLPQVYALAVLPQLLTQLHTWSEVSGKVLGGADLFLQGVLVPQVGCCYTDCTPAVACWNSHAWRKRQLLARQVICTALFYRALGGACLLSMHLTLVPGPLAAPQGGLPDFLAGSPRSLCVPGNPIPFAGELAGIFAAEVSRMLLSWSGRISCGGSIAIQMQHFAAPTAPADPLRSKQPACALPCLCRSGQDGGQQG